MYALNSGGLHIINVDGKEETLFKNIQGKGVLVDSFGNIVVYVDYSLIQKFNSRGEKLWEYTGPWTGQPSMAVDSKGNVFAAKWLDGCYGFCDNSVHELSSSHGTLMKKFQSTSKGDDLVSDLAVDANDNLYVATSTAITKYQTK